MDVADYNMSDHPRVCGEKAQTRSGDSLFIGSPPRVRGEGRSGILSHIRKRITPACAGRRRRRKKRIRPGWDHPRVCGEKPVVNPKCQSGKGSPPRVRGEGKPGARPAPPPRITPACAGRRIRFIGSGGTVTDHPRVCGEKYYQRCYIDFLSGSPPRVRGEDDKCKVFTSDAGSPPRVRGEDFYAHFGVKMRGITPACAGRSGRTGARSSSTWDHPRVCGEKTASTAPSFFLGGSPPRVRGEGVGVDTHAQRTGITPACAGRRLHLKTYDLLRTDHPRVCGEKAFTQGCGPNLRKSPPRARGEGRPPKKSCSKFGITPACAGRSSGST